MASVIFDTLANAWTQILLDTPCYASIHFEFPTPDDPAASEVDGLSYARSPFIWDTAASQRALVNNDSLEWLNLDATTIIGVGTWDAPTGGNLLLFHQFDEPVSVADLGSYGLDARQLFVVV
jgi:hypothetical protein